VAPSKPLMDKAAMKSLLKQATQSKPARFAFGIGEDAATVALLMDKTAAGLKLETELKSKVSGVRNPRFGTVYAGGDQEDADPKLVRFYVNKAVSGVAKRLIKTLKGTGFSKVIVLTEDGAVLESHEEADEEELAASGDKPAATDGVPVPPPPPGTATASPPPPPQQEAPKPDAGALAKALAALIPQIPGVVATNAEAGETLKKLAGQANVYIKTGNLTYAANAIEQLRLALEGAQKPKESASSFDKPRQIWIATHAKIRSEIEGLRTEIRNTYKDSDQAGEIDAGYQNVVMPAIEQFDMRIADRLTAAEKETNPQERGSARGRDEGDHRVIPEGSRRPALRGSRCEPLQAARPAEDHCGDADRARGDGAITRRRRPPP
jgi:hypothetical protein